jgi:competence protein ComEC
MLHTFSKQLLLFWKRAPALEIALYLLLGTGCYLASPLFFIPLSLLFLLIKGFSLSSKRAVIVHYTSSSLLILGGCLYTHYHNLPILSADTPIIGDALVNITQKRSTTFFGKTSLYYKATLLIFESEHHLYKDLPCSFNLKEKDAILADKHYYFKDILLLSKTPKQFMIKFQKNSQKIPLKHSTSLTEWRYLQKEKAKEHLTKHIQDPKVLKFLSALTLGYLDQKTLCYEFSKAGVQHLLTISGFHFALLAMSLSFLLKPFLPKKILCFSLIALLSLYVVYLGPSPSVSRSWLAILLYLIAELFEYDCSGLNALGIAALIAFLECPLSITHLGFQLSYLATLGIIAFYEPCERILHLLIPPRSLSMLCQMPVHQKICYYCLVILRKAIALDFAVNTLTIPILFYEFGNFPLFSFFYNLLIPFLVSGSLFLLLLGFLCSFFPPLCHLIHHINDLYTREILSLVAYAPKGLEIFLYIPHVSLYLAITALTLAFLILVNLKRLSN